MQDYDSDSQSEPETKDRKPNNKIDSSNFKSELDYRRNDAEPTEINLKDQNVDGDSSSVFTDRPKNIKGFKRDKSRNIICLDCGKQFKHKNSYNYHKKM